MSCGVGCRCCSDPALLWLWRRLAAIARIGPLAWEPPHVTGAALKRHKQTNKQTNLCICVFPYCWFLTRIFLYFIPTPNQNSAYFGDTSEGN